MNIFSLIVLIFVLLKIIDGYKKGMVKEIISFVSLIVLCVVVLLIGNGLRSYVERQFVNVIIMILLLCVLGIVHHLLGLVFFSAKMIIKLPIVNWLDKVLGIVVGILETVLILWTIYTFLGVQDMGMLGKLVLESTAENPVLVWIYEHNYLAKWIQDAEEIIPLELFQ